MASETNIVWHSILKWKRCILLLLLVGAIYTAGFLYGHVSARSDARHLLHDSVASRWALSGGGGEREKTVVDPLMARKLQLEVDLNKPPQKDEARGEYKNATKRPTLMDNDQFPKVQAQDDVTVKKEELEVVESDQGYQAHWVHVNGSFQQRLAAYNTAVARLREHVVELRASMEWTDIHEPLEVLWCNGDDCLQMMGKYPHIQTIALAWQGYEQLGEWSSLDDTANMPYQVFYPWTASEPLCSYIQTPAQTKARWGAVFNRQCSTEVNITQKPISLEPVYLHGKPINPRDYWPNNGESYPAYFYTTPPPHLFHLHVLQDGVITKLGDVISGPLKLLLYTCSQDTDPRPPPDYRTSPLYDEVFIVTQYWGTQFFHKMAEGYPRIAPYIDFLKTHPSIKIHVAEVGGYTAAFMAMLGIDSSRLITDTCRAKVIYLPQSTPCGFAQAQSSALLSSRLRDVQKLKYGSTFHRRNSIVMIQRITHERRFVQRDEIQRLLQRLAEEFSLQLVLFRDDPSPGMTETMQIFQQAVLVVAPHGAGLANLLYAQPGTYVIEGVCNRPHVNMCFQWLAHVLGHHYHAIMAKTGCLSVIDIDTAEVERVARIYLQLATL